ncbi:MAG: hypothetical protein OXF88_01440 [Rhodobacteraceae bacterium]|nr:hypothetical protein [Paracoccaceae bacterium]MCY4141069.1 hypothetical protein [Paracoccaceae bacterium]
MRTFPAALVVFLAAAAVAQAHFPDNCDEIIVAATKATNELAASRAEKNNWLSDWNESLGSSIRPFTMDEFAEFFMIEARIAEAQALFDDALDELITCTGGL